MNSNKFESKKTLITIVILCLLFCGVFVALNSVNKKIYSNVEESLSLNNDKKIVRTVASVEIEPSENFQEVVEVTEITGAIELAGTTAEDNVDTANDSAKPTDLVIESNEVVEKQFTENTIVKEDYKEAKIGNPILVTAEAFYCEHKRRKVPIKLEWEPVNGADSYDVKIHRLYTGEKRVFRVRKNKKHIMIYPNARYKWKVVAIDKKNNRLTGFSKIRNLHVIAPDGDQEVSNYETNFPGFKGELEKVDHTHEFNLNYVSAKPIIDQVQEGHKKQVEKEILSRVPASVQDNDYTLWSKFWVNMGRGLNLTSYEQQIIDTANLTYDAVKSPNFRGEAGFFLSDKAAIIASGFQSPGNLVDTSANLNEEYTWTSYSLEVAYLLGDGKVDKSIRSNWYLRYGLHQHKLPLLEVFPSSSELFILENTLINLSLGLGNRTKFSKDLRTDIFLRYQHPVSSKANKNTYSLDSGMLIDFYFAANYQLHRNFHMGLFLNSQYFNLDYSLDNSFEAVKGTQSLFNNIFGMYLGFEL